MTRQEFDPWIEQHYNELLKVARRRLNTDDDARDALQTAVVGMLGSPSFMSAPIAYAWPRAVKFVVQAAYNLRRSQQRQRTLIREQKKISAAGALHGWKRPAPRAE